MRIIFITSLYEVVLSSINYNSLQCRQHWQYSITSIYLAVIFLGAHLSILSFIQIRKLYSVKYTSSVCDSHQRLLNRGWYSYAIIQKVLWIWNKIHDKYECFINMLQDYIYIAYNYKTTYKNILGRCDTTCINK